MADFLRQNKIAIEKYLPEYLTKDDTLKIILQLDSLEHERIKDGVDSGQLTKKEARHLRARQAKIRHDKRVARMDGVVTPAERKQLHKEQRRASRAIHRQKHDEQHR